MARVTPKGKFAIPLGRNQSPAKAEEKSSKPSAPKNDDKTVIMRILSAMPDMISAVVRQTIQGIPAPVIHVDSKPPDVKVNSPVYINPPDIKVPPTTVNVPESQAPVVHVDPPEVNLSIKRPGAWTFTFDRNEYGQLTTIWAEEGIKKK